MELESTIPVQLQQRAQITGPENADIYDDGFLHIEHDNYYISCAGETIKLRRTEFLIISRLARNAERIVSAEDLWGHAWNGKKALNPLSLYAYIYTLRRKLAPYGIEIETLVHVGYRLISKHVQG
jgi:DNA-binding response OmpR family regulator